MSDASDSSSSATSDGLKPCPFCGSHEVRVVYLPEVAILETGGTVQCVNCTAYVEFDCANDDALPVAWNRRASGWTSVEERLPEAFAPVLIYPVKLRGAHRCRGVACWTGGVWQSLAPQSLAPGEDADLGWYYPTPTHWMPLPERPS